MVRPARRRHLRDAATMCHAVMKLSDGTVNLRCELDDGHLEQGVKHKDGCSRWGTPAPPTGS